MHLVCMCCTQRIWNKVMIAFHNACPFGAVASVHAWERAGALIQVIARRLLKLPVYRYVDDFFSCDRCLCLLESLCGVASSHAYVAGWRR